jgi:hypothetical protein
MMNPPKAYDSKGRHQAYAQKSGASTARLRCDREQPVLQLRKTWLRMSVPAAAVYRASGLDVMVDFVPWRFLDAGQSSVRSVSSLPASKNQHKGGHPYWGMNVLPDGPTPVT